jgi:hypothetical protein
MTTGSERVSEEWWSVLKDMDAEGVPVHVNEGHRTMARQAQLVREQGRYPNGVGGYGTGAAAPSPSAPHIRLGRVDHAIDFGGDAARIVRELEKRGIKAWRPMSKEPWHVEVDAGDLEAYHHRYTKSYKPGKAPKDAVRIVKAHLKKHGYKGIKMDGRQGLVYRLALGRFRRKHKLGHSSALTPTTWRLLREG